MHCGAATQRIRTRWREAIRVVEEGGRGCRDGGVGGVGIEAEREVAVNVKAEVAAITDTVEMDVIAKAAGRKKVAAHQRSVSA